MQVSKEQIDPCSIKLTITVDAADVATAFDKSYRAIGRHTAIAGFRPGKAPRPVLERHLDLGRVETRSREVLVSQTLDAALKQEEITAYDDAEVEYGALSDKAEWSYTATIPLPPKITLGDYQTFNVNRTTRTVDDEAVEQAVMELRREAEKLEIVTDRGLEISDVAICEVWMGDQTDSEPQLMGRRYIRLADAEPDFVEALLGAATDEVREFIRTAPATSDGGSADSESPKAEMHYRVQVNTIMATSLPDVTDAWVNERLNLATVDEMYSTLRTTLQQKFDRDSEAEVGAALIEQLCERSEAHIPLQSVIRTAKRQLATMQAQLEKDGRTLDEYFSRRGLTVQQGFETLVGQLHSISVKKHVLEQLARQESLIPTQEENQQVVRNAVGQAIATSSTELTSDEVQKIAGDAAEALFMAKLVDFLKSRAVITDTPAPVPPANAAQIDPESTSGA